LAEITVSRNKLHLPIDTILPISGTNLTKFPIVIKGYENLSFHTARGTLPHVITPFTVSSSVVQVVWKSTRLGRSDILVVQRYFLSAFVRRRYNPD